MLRCANLINSRCACESTFFVFSCLAKNAVITGFNTDIEFGGVTYHVQTEDKGLSKPIILSLVYDRGTILASKREPYDDLLSAEKFDEKLLAKRLQKQHKLICAAVRAGRIEELKQMTARDSEAAKLPARQKAAVKSTKSRIDSIKKPAADVFETKTIEAGIPIPKPAFEMGVQRPAKTLEEPIIESVIAIEEEIMLPDEAVEILSEMSGQERPANNRLNIEILGETKFKGGERNTVWFMVCRGSHRKVVAGAQIMVKILGSSFRPVIFHAATDINGLANVNLQLPNFKSGRAAFLVRAISDGEEIELRRSMMHG